MNWRQEMKRLRRAANLTQAEAAGRAGLSKDAVVDTEAPSRRKHPSLDTVTGLLNAYGARPAERNAVLRALNYPPEPVGALRRVWKRDARGWREEVNSLPYPVLVFEDLYELVHWNRAAELVGEYDFSTLPPSAGRNLLRIAAMPHFRTHSLNWSEIIGHLIRLLKSEHGDMSGGSANDQYFMRLLGMLQEEFPEATAEFIAIFLATPPAELEIRNIYYPEWQVADETLQFTCLATGFNEWDGIYPNDWFPADAVTWDWLSARLLDVPEPAPEQHTPWWEVLRAARESRRLSRAALAEAASVSPSWIERIELGRIEHPGRERIVRLAESLALGCYDTNRVLRDLKLPTEPSDFARLLAGAPPRIGTRTRSPRTWPPLTVEHLLAEADDVTWPSLVVDRACTIVGGNEPASRALGVDLRPGRIPPHRRSLLGFVLSPETQSQCINWEEVAPVLVPSALRAVLEGRADRPSPLSPVADELRVRAPETVAHLMSLWDQTPDPIQAVRALVPLVWRNGSDVLNFFATIAVRSIVSGYWTIDLQPADADTWRWFGVERRER